MSPVDRPPDNDTYFMGIAFAVRGRANCTGNRVGAVIVRHDRVISTGYNGVPSGMKNCLEGGVSVVRIRAGVFLRVPATIYVSVFTQSKIRC